MKALVTIIENETMVHCVEKMILIILFLIHYSHLEYSKNYKEEIKNKTVLNISYPVVILNKIKLKLLIYPSCKY